jgi:hypothetical protein
MRKSIVLGVFAVAYFGLLPRHAASQSLVQGQPETVNQCLGQQNRPTGEDCFCGAYPRETGRSMTNVAGVNVIAIHYKTDTVVSGYSNNFGCWYLTESKTDPAYFLVGYDFATKTDFGGSCESHYNLLTDPRGESLMHDGNYQECGVAWPTTPEEVEFKFRLKGKDDENHNFELFPVDKKGNTALFGIIVDVQKGRHSGVAEFTLYYAKRP